ncbi:MAG: hypothetical protein JWO05_1461 [Gemmatimonadetes bacterium]|nr:hypothetical protein [Gemmatimonadota bacterium]
MLTRTIAGLFLAAATLAGPAAGAQAAKSTKATKPATAPWPARAIRHDVPMTNMIRRAFAMGTRDSTGHPGRNYWQLRTDYVISARLDEATHTVSGRERVVIHNNSDSALTSLQLRLDQNIFASNVPRGETVPEITDGMKISWMKLDGADVALVAPQSGRLRGAGGAVTQPTVANIKETTTRVSLPKAIAAGASVTLEAEWSFRVPQSEGVRGERMGRWTDSLYQVAQWYPRVAVYDDLRGWDTDPYLGLSEFYNNFGSFDVTIDVPAAWVVGATGVLQNASDVLTQPVRDRLAAAMQTDSVQVVLAAGERGTNAGTNGRQQWHFTADSVADFAWGTSDRYMWRATHANIPGGKGPVLVSNLFTPGRLAANVEAAKLGRHALEFYSKLWMPYAWSTLTIVDGPEGGMEYPTFIMSTAGAADHETGHQWWPMMVGVNETWYGWMDEGFNNWMNTLSAADRAGRALPNNGGQGYGNTSGNEREAPLMWDANYGGPNYSFQAYGKSGPMLSMLGGMVGDSAVFRAQSEYAKAWRFRHPSPWDYMFSMQRSLGRDLGWFWYYWLFTTESVEGSIANVKTAGRTTTVTVQQDGQMPSPVVIRVTFAPTGAKLRPMANAVMTDSVTAVVTWPVDVWFGGKKTFDAALDFGGRKIEKLMLDPQCRFPDRNPEDNVWPREPAWVAPARTQGPPDPNAPIRPGTCRVVR